MESSPLIAETYDREQSLSVSKGEDSFIKTLSDKDGKEMEREYQIAFVNGSDGSWDIVKTFVAEDDECANAFAEANYKGQEWYVLCNGENINN